MDRPLLSLASLATIVLTSCGGAPTRVAAPTWDPAGLSEEILAKLDANADAALDAEELKGAPGLAAGSRFIDLDKDGKITGSELEARFELYRSSRIGLRSPSFRLSYKGRPVQEADVVFVPESFLEGIVESARGVTDVEGIVVPQADGQDVPGMRIGFYRVQIASPKTKIPAKYSGVDSALGADVSLAEDPDSYGVNELKLID